VLHAAIKRFQPKLGSLLAPLEPVRRWLRFHRRVLLGSRRLRRAVRAGAPLRIVVGCGNTRQPGWIETDIELLNILHPPDWQRHFRKNSLTAILAEHVWEHLTPAEGAAAARLCHEYLAPGGWLRLAVPDGFHPDAAYLELVKIGGTGAGAADHKVLYTHESLGRMLTEAGFDLERLEYFDAAGTFHAQAWNPADGLVHRSLPFDPRNADGRPHYTSLIIDARKPRA
jgi:predicted SAM-dependent methyltransferase